MKQYEKGIYTLANDAVYDQLIALLNSIRRNMSKDLPICIIPYDDRMDKVKAAIKKYKNVFIFDNEKILKKYERFGFKLINYIVKKKKLEFDETFKSRIKMFRRFSIFEGVFNKFIFCDADTLVMKKNNDVFNKLKNYDFVFDDWEHKKAKADAPLNMDLILKNVFFNEKKIRMNFHSDDFFGSKKEESKKNTLSEVQRKLFSENNIDWIRQPSVAFFFCYYTLVLNKKNYNYTFANNPKKRTGNIAGVDHFVEKNKVLYNKEGMKPIHRIHYMGYSSVDFVRLCKGEDVGLPHQELFLYYRFMNEPEKMPKILKKAIFYVLVKRQLLELINRIKNKLQ